jgi:hypothetical protein
MSSSVENNFHDSVTLSLVEAKLLDLVEVESLSVNQRDPSKDCMLSIDLNQELKDTSDGVEAVAICDLPRRQLISQSIQSQCVNFM